MLPEEIEMEDITVSKSGWRVTLSYKGEGYFGTYTQNIDPLTKDISDDPLVRFTVYKRVDSKYEAVQYGSQKTFLRPTDKQETLIEAARMVLNEVINYDGSAPPNLFYKYLGKIHLCNGKPRLLPAIGSPQDLDD